MARPDINQVNVDKRRHFVRRLEGESRPRGPGRGGHIEGQVNIRVQRGVAPRVRSEQPDPRWGDKPDGPFDDVADDAI